MDLILAAIIGAVAAAFINLLVTASVEVNRHDLLVDERDQDLEEWIVVRNRKLKQRWQEIEEQARAAGVDRGSTIPAGRAVVQTNLLYEYRDELRDARGFVRRIAVEERSAHRLLRLLKRQPFPDLATPRRAARLIDYWEEGTGRNTLTWSLDDILEELPQRATSRARSPGVDSS